MVVTVLSEWLKYRDTTCLTEKRAAAIRTKNMAGFTTPRPGRMIIIVPKKPIIIADHR